MIILAAIAALSLPPCEYEDSTNCHWNASTRGNGIGQSFIAIGPIIIHTSEGTL